MPQAQDSWLFPYKPLDVMAFLRSIGSPRVMDMPLFAGWISSAAEGHNLNPRWLLMLAEKEQSFLSRPKGGAGWQRALDWTLGYGATDSHDISIYKGTKKQVDSAATGLWKYLTPGNSLYVGPLVGKKFTDPHGESYTPANLVEAALLQYCPHVYALRDAVAIYTRYWPEEKEKPMPTLEDIAQAAEAVVRARQRGDTEATYHGVRFNLGERGYCQRLVRLCHEAANVPSPWASCCAHSTQQHLEGAGLDVSGAVRGGIVSFSLKSAICSVCGQTVGHTAICLGNGVVVENTSSGQRGNPRAAGTKMTALVDIGLSRVVGYYNALKPKSPYANGPCRVKVNDVDGPGVIRANVVYFPDGVTSVRAWAERLGGHAYDHLPQENRVYVYVPGNPPVPGR